MKRISVLRTIGLLGWSLLVAQGASAHSASDAYLTLDAQGQTPTTLRLQWDIALRDLDFVLKLDDDGDGNITWAELRRHQAAISQYAQARLKVLADGTACPTRLARQRVGRHADGAYSVLFLEAQCASKPQRLTLDYRLFFDIDPSHRAIVVAHIGADTATALMSPQNARIDLELARPSRSEAKPSPLVSKSR